MIETLTSPAHLAAFFAEHAWYSYDPKIETPEQGRLRCAAELASASMRAFEDGFSFEWSIDHEIDSRSFSKSRPHWSLYQCAMRDANGDVCGSLGGVDFGRDGDPWSDPYRRVVEAQLALEHYRA